ncbi:twist-related protein-like [Ptychodera flava]|uniref:twist-related protein-like n=1 Tax=Ptychodera flava TaxID=63121 RepID=UPI00396AA20F
MSHSLTTKSSNKLKMPLKLHAKTASVDILSNEHRSPCYVKLKRTPHNRVCASSKMLSMTSFSVKRKHWLLANRKARSCDAVMNTAFQDLKKCIPNLTHGEADEVQTLTVASKYISYLMELLGVDDPNEVSMETKANSTDTVYSALKTWSVE